MKFIPKKGGNDGYSRLTNLLAGGIEVSGNIEIKVPGNKTVRIVIDTVDDSAVREVVDQVEIPIEPIEK